MTPDEIDVGLTSRGLREGQKVFSSRYTLVRVLGRGGMGVVWLARDEKLGRQAALKFLPELLVHDRLALDELKRETSRCLELTHPHIVRIYDFVEDEPRSLACIAMEYVDGDNLSAMRLEKPHRHFEVDDIRAWIGHLCDALAYAHERAQVVHRDLKPANLMLNSRGELKVTDFGIARSLLDSVTRVSGARSGASGTIAYMSPQQALGERTSPLDDVYAVGATTYDLLTGKPPFFSGEILAQLREKVPPPMTARREEFRSAGAPIPREWEENRRSLPRQESRRPPAKHRRSRRAARPSDRIGRANAASAINSTSKRPSSGAATSTSAGRPSLRHSRAGARCRWSGLVVRRRATAARRKRSPRPRECRRATAAGG